MTTELAIAIVAAAAGAIASVSGFGIGSTLTPLLSLWLGTKLAVAAVSIPHALGTGLRLWMLRAHVDRSVLRSFGVMSALGGLGGAALHARATSATLTIIFAALLVFAGLGGLTGVAERMRFGRRTAWVAGAASGLFGGLVGNQGGIRSAALMGFDVPKEAFVATATAIALFVDAARVPVYFAAEAARLSRSWHLIAIASVGVLAGTVAGARLLRHIPERIFHRAVAALILALGVFMFLRVRAG